MLSNSTFDVPKAQWEAAKAEAKEVMIKRAKVRGMIAYSDLVPRIHALAMNAHDPRLFHLLGQISSEEDAAGRGMLTVIGSRIKFGVKHINHSVSPGSPEPLR